MFARLAASGTVALILAGSMILGVAAPANADGIGRAWDIWQYALTIKGGQLQAAMGDKAGAAWTAQSARLAATTASQYTVQSIYGNVDVHDVGEVIPLSKPRTEGLPGKRFNILPGGRGPSIPAFPAKKFYQSIGGAGGAATIGVTSYMFRGDIANGLLGWTGLDVNGTVCADPVAGGANFVNFLSGQDCDVWRAAQDFVPNADLTPEMVNGYCGNMAGVDLPGQGVQLSDLQPKCRSGLGYARANPANSPWRLYNAPMITNVSPDGSNTFRFDIDLGGEPFESNLFYTSGPSLNYRCIDATGKVVITAGNGGFSLGRSSYHLASCSTGYRLVAWLKTPLPAQEATPSAQYPKETKYNLLFVQGQPLAAIVDPDPERWLKCVVVDNSGGVYEGLSPKFRESELEFQQPNCPQVSPGKDIHSFRITVEGGAESKVWREEKVSPEYNDYVTSNPECVTAVTCLTDLVRTADGISCFALGSACDGWLKSPTRDVDYRCEHGGKTTAMSDCYVYAPLFNTEKRLAGNAYADPKTGEEILGGGTSLSGESQVMGRPVGNPNSGRDCWGSRGWGELNPLEWVVVPVQCALQWAWVPRSAVVQLNGEKINSEWKTTAPGKVINTVTNWKIQFNINGCEGLPFNFKYGPVTQNIGIPSACPGTRYAEIAAWVRTVSGVLFAIGAAWTIRGMASSSIGFNKGV